MNKTFSYCILHYKNSVCLTELLNVGIIFYFPEEKQLKFILGDLNRVKKIYPNISIPLLKLYIISIERNVKEFNNLEIENFMDFIDKNILHEDAAGLTFSRQHIPINVFPSNEIAIEELSKLYLPTLKK